MIVEGLAIGELPGETVVAMHGFERKVGGAVQGHQELVAKEPKICQHAVPFKALKDLNKHRIKVARRDRIEQCADLIVTGNLLHAQQGMGVIVTFGVLQPAVVLQRRQKRRRLSEKDAKGAQGSIVDGISGVWPLGAMVGQLSDPSVQDALEDLEV